MATLTPQLKIKVFSPYQTFFEGSAVSLSARNKAGPFDVLYDHINFFSLLESCDVEINLNNEMLKIPIENGFMKVTNNEVVLFANV